MDRIINLIINFINYEIDYKSKEKIQNVCSKLIYLSKINHSLDHICSNEKNNYLVAHYVRNICTTF